MLSMKRRTDTETDPSVTCKEDFEDYFTMFDNSESDESEEKVEKINCDILPGNLMPFGLFKERNGTSNTLRTVKTGKLTVKLRHVNFFCKKMYTLCLKNY